MKPLFGKKFFIYWNLHKNCWSLKCTKTQKVLFHAETVQLKDATFKVSEAGRQRVLKEKQKNVHAGVIGQVQFFIPVGNPLGIEIGLDNFEKVSYNPYKGNSFFLVDSGEKIYNTSNTVIMGNKMVYKRV